MTQGMFPVRFAKMYIVSPPWWMRALMAVMGVFLSKKIKDRFQLVSKGALKSTLYDKNPGLKELLAERRFGCGIKRDSVADKTEQAGVGVSPSDLKA